MLVKIQKTTREARPLKYPQSGEDPNTPYTGLMIQGSWYNCKGHHQNLYNKTVDMELSGDFCRLAVPPSAPAQQTQQPAASTAQAVPPTEPQGVQRVTLSTLTTVMQRVHRALPVEWAQEVSGARAYAQVINTVLMGVIKGDVAVDDAANDAFCGIPGQDAPLPDEHEDAAWKRTA